MEVGGATIDLAMATEEVGVVVVKVGGATVERHGTLSAEESRERC